MNLDSAIPMNWKEAVPEDEITKFKEETGNEYTEKQGAPTRTHPAKSHRQQRYVQQGVPRRERSAFLCWWCDEPALPAMRQTLVGLPRCSNRQGWLGRMPAPDGR